MKLILENWRKFCDLNENKQEQELDEGLKDLALAGLMGLGLGGFSPDAKADTPDSGAETTQQVQTSQDNVGDNYKNITADDFKFFPAGGGDFVVYSPADLKSQGIDIKQHIQDLKQKHGFDVTKTSLIEKDGKRFVGLVNIPSADLDFLTLDQFHNISDKQNYDIFTHKLTGANVAVKVGTAKHKQVSTSDQYEAK